ncbi:MAG: SDR family NAD(P)-dependent oxidoreductase, partial [Anaerolineae bacterium]|nr:SDR family NAD(P)-dependent oxidoreductase [Anaerolineae bacterium]
MQRTALVTGADRGLGLALVEGLLDRGWRVFAGQYMAAWPALSELAERHSNALTIVPLDVGSKASVRAAAVAVTREGDHLDMIISNAGVSSPAMKRRISEPQDYEEMHRLYDVNTLGALRVIEAFLPLMAQGGFKRLCFVSSEAGSITAARRTSWYSYCMSKAALNMAVKIMFNDLHPEGYTFRLYHPGWMRTYMSGKKGTAADLEPEDAAAKALPIFLNA